MKSVPCRIAGLALIASGLFGFSSSLTAQDNEEPQPIVSRAISATVDYGNDAIFQPTKHDPDFDRLGLRPQQLVTITVQFPVDLAGQVILVDPLEGGSLTVPEEGVFIGVDGNITFQFQGGDAFGACRLAVHQPDDSNFIQFWIVDPDHPENTPPDLPGAY